MLNNVLHILIIELKQFYLVWQHKGKVLMVVYVCLPLSYLTVDVPEPKLKRYEILIIMDCL